MLTGRPVKRRHRWQ